MPDPLPPDNTSNESNPSLPSVGTPCRVETFETAEGAHIRHEYDERGRLMMRTETVVGVVLSNPGDPFGTRGEEPPGSVFRYDRAGCLRSVVRPDGSRTEHIYDDQTRRLESIDDYAQCAAVTAHLDDEPRDDPRS